MSEQIYDQLFGTSAAENYQRYFVPAIGRPVAEDLMEIARLQPGERVLDVACGTGVVTRLAAERVGSAGSVAGLDVNGGMLTVARSETSSDMKIDWHEASAESMPLGDDAFDVVLCQMGLQFVPNKLAALREMRRVLDTDGRVHLTLPGPKPRIFEVMTDGLARHLGQEAAFVCDLVFSMHGANEITELMESVGFRKIEVQFKPKSLLVPGPQDFLWQYVFSTPMAEAATRAGAQGREALERDVCDRWQEFVVNGRLSFEVGMTTASAVK